MLRTLSIRLGVPVFPGVVLAFAGRVTGVERADDNGGVDVAVEFSATSALGTHLSGTATLDLR
jgi:hypothetical protein